MARKGHNVTVYESNTELSELGAGIQLQPNATRILYRWGLQDEFRKLSNEPSVMKLMRYSDARVVGEIAHNPQQEWEYGFPHWQCYRPDLQMLLYDAAVAAGAKVQFSSRVVDADVDKGIIILGDGRREEADLVVVADGIQSRFRHLLPDNADAKAVTCNEFCFRAVISRELMESDPETARLMKGEDSMVWSGPGVVVLGYPVSGSENRRYNTLISTPRPCDIPVGRWGEPGDIQEAQGLVKDFCPVVRKLWSLVAADDCVKWTLGEVPKIESYVSTSGRSVLIGDAAHAIPPQAGQGGGMSLEDCAALGEFVFAATNVDDLARKMKALQDFRQPRIEIIRALAHGNQSFMTLPDGPAQQQRDQLWGAMTAKWKAELAELGEEGIKAKPRPRPVPGNAGDDMRSPESREDMFGYDVFAEATKYLGTLE